MTQRNHLIKTQNIRAPKLGDLCYTTSIRIISLKRLIEFWQIHPDEEQSLRAWFSEAKEASSETPADIMALYRNANILPGSRVVFNIKGNDYRLVVAIEYRYGEIFIRFVGTQAERDRIDAARI